ncbi:MAG TPA: class I SAM-dependent methyltransferase [Pseudonocardia sp.]|uniref:class I SAM-dependent methyltransferase n=1 Tax=Pseudonocardia sp. TaxID=60912 RepID=UPI002F423CD9
MDAGPDGWGRALYVQVLDALRLAPDAHLLDVGCGNGELCRLASDRGLLVTGVDADPDALRQTATLVPRARLYRARLPELPLADGEAGAVSCVQVLMHLANPLVALRELARVGAEGAPVAVTVWGPPEQCAVGGFGEALAPILGPPPWRYGAARGQPAGPPPLSDAGRLTKLATMAGLAVDTERDVHCEFGYPDERALLASLHAAELGRRAVAVAGRVRVRRAVRDGMARYRVADGGYRLENTFRMLVARA